MKKELHNVRVTKPICDLVITAEGPQTTQQLVIGTQFI